MGSLDGPLWLSVGDEVGAATLGEVGVVMTLLAAEAISTALE